MASDEQRKRAKDRQFQSEALRWLPEDFREAVILVDVQDQSYQTAAEVLGVPLGTVRSQLFRGRRLLQEALVAYARDAGLTQAGHTPPETGGSTEGAPAAEHRRCGRLTICAGWTTCSTATP